MSARVDRRRRVLTAAAPRWNDRNERSLTSGGSVTKPAEIVGELNRRFLAGDRDGAMELLDPDLRIEQPASLPHGGWHHGHDGMAAMGQTFGEHWDRRIEDPRLLDCGDTVVQVTRQTWTARATSRSATVEVVELLSVADGRVTEIRVFPQDTHTLLATLDDAS
jgi:ketosteroid isomerase-like protein